MWACIGGLFFYLWIILYLRINSIKNKTRYIVESNYKFLLLIFIFYGTFGICYGDYWGYGQLVENAYKTYLSYHGEEWDRYIHMETIYNYLAVLCQGNYHLWRLCWFSVQFCGIFFLLKKFGCNNYEAFYVFALFPLQSICGGRVSWGIAFFWLGLFAFLKFKKLKYLFFLVAAAFSHTSMLLLFVLLPLMFVNVNKKIVITFIVLVPTLAVALGDMLETMMDNLALMSSLSSASTLESKISMYQNDANEAYWGQSFGEFIHLLVSRLPLYYLVCRVLYDYFRGKINFDSSGKKLFNITFFLFAYTCVVLIAELGNASFYGRFFVMLYLPIYVLTYVMNRGYYMRKIDYRCCVYLFFLSFVFLYMKAIYYYSVNGIVLHDAVD